MLFDGRERRDIEIGKTGGRSELTLANKVLEAPVYLIYTGPLKQ